MSRLSIVIPVYNDLASLRILVDRLAREPAVEADTLSVLVVDDGSSPPVTDQLHDMPAHLALHVVTLRRNVGHQRAIAVGLAEEVAMERADLIAIMDGDGEDRPEDVSRLIAAVNAASGNVIAVAERTRRSEGLMFTALYHAYRLLFLLLVGEHIRFGNFCAMKIDAARRLVQMNELWLNLPATIIRSRIPIVKVSTTRGTRYQGATQMNLVALVTHGLSAIAVFMQRVLTRVVLATLALAMFCVAAAFTALFLKIFGAATPGWLTTVFGTLFVVLISTGAVCLVGLFIGMTAATNPAPAPSESHRSLISGVTEHRTGTVESRHRGG